MRIINKRKLVQSLKKEKFEDLNKNLGGKI